MVYCNRNYMGYMTMGNKNRKAARATTAAVVVAAPQESTAVQQTAAPQHNAPIQLYTVVAPKRPLGTATKNGLAGTAGTHAALASAAAQHDGKLTWAQVQEVCAAQGDKAFARYALNRLRVLLPVAQQSS
jgi:hypothetical protein